ncbi:carbohydrate-binding module family 13 protein [Crepidotus variabilis]|uniref:Carbohydrate-binding module family 13 protein n=1 Tax=Crepidotus variabilis TaxID=179855 RepID=A0A9P6EJD3_9AGAR|nr:carbohydrate-binding module family 13 protein [Crepidotus variabilis]
MSITNGGRFYIHNKKAGTVIDLDTRDNRSVQCWSKWGGANQQWEFLQVEGGWQIRNVAQRTYLTFDGNAQDGQRLIGSQNPFTWNIWPSDHDQRAYMICVPNTKQLIDLSDHGNIRDGTAVQLWTTFKSDNQLWTVENV